MEAGSVEGGVRVLGLGAFVRGIDRSDPCQPPRQMEHRKITILVSVLDRSRLSE